MANTSATGGYLVPSVSPVYDEALEDIFQGFIAGVTEIPGDMVRPRWVPEPPNQPSFDTPWAAYGITQSAGDWATADTPDPTLFGGTGGLVQQRDEIITILVSFYGPGCSANAEKYRCGVLVPQNMNILRDAYNIVVVGVGESIAVPALTQQKWVKRIDVRSEFRRRVSRQYPINSLLSASVQFGTGAVQTSIEIIN